MHLAVADCDSIEFNESHGSSAKLLTLVYCLISRLMIDLRNVISYRGMLRERFHSQAFEQLHNYMNLKTVEFVDISSDNNISHFDCVTNFS